MGSSLALFLLRFYGGIIILLGGVCLVLTVLGKIIDRLKEIRAYRRSQYI